MCRAVVRWLVFAWPVWLWVVWVVFDGLGGLGGWVVCVALPGGIHSAVQGRSVGAILIVSARRPLRLAACLFLYITIYIRLCVCVYVIFINFTSFLPFARVGGCDRFWFMALLLAQRFSPASASHLPPDFLWHTHQFSQLVSLAVCVRFLGSPQNDAGKRLWQMPARQ